MVDFPSNLGLFPAVFEGRVSVPCRLIQTLRFCDTGSVDRTLTVYLGTRVPECPSAVPRYPGNRVSACSQYSQSPVDRTGSTETQSLDEATRHRNTTLKDGRKKDSSRKEIDHEWALEWRSEADF